MCDDGWKEIYDRLKSTESKNVHDSLAIWFPTCNGLPETIEKTKVRHPKGCEAHGGCDTDVDGTSAMDLATLQLQKYIAVRRARAKIRSALVFRSMLQEVRCVRAAIQLRLLATINMSLLAGLC